jgi:hypothetical protein
MAGATQERTLLGVGSTAGLGWAWNRRIVPRLFRPFGREYGSRTTSPLG